MIFSPKKCKSTELPVSEKRKEQFYCLQNITIILSSDGKYFNVIDGQQRLTTLSIVLSYLKEEDLVKKRINYEIRKTTATFLRHIISNKSRK